MLRFVVFLFLLFVFSTNFVFAHGDGEIIDGVKVSFTQEPLSPFVGENVVVTVSVEDEDGNVMSNFSGDIQIFYVSTKQYQGGDVQESRELIYESHADTDSSGNSFVEYVFEDEAVYEVVYLWNNRQDSASHIVFPREPSSFFTESEIGKRIWLFVGIAFAGFLAGAASTFVLLTITIRKKR